MNGELKRKLFNYEVVPADKVWDQLASALDEEVDAQFPQKLYKAEIHPPSGVWDRIAPSLDADVTDEYPAKLYNLEVAPPANAWAQISAALQEQQALPQIPSKRKIVPFIRYAAAACVIGLVALGTVKLVMNRRSSNDSVAAKTVIPKSVAPGTVQPGTNQDSSLQINRVASNNLPTAGTTVTKTSVVSKRRALNQTTGYMTLLAGVSAAITNTSTPGFQHASLKVSEVPGNCGTISEEDRYLNFMNPNGYLVRISKKLAESLKCYLTTAATPDNQCDEQIKKWREKIAQFPPASSDNFMDILDIIKTAQEKEL